MTALADLSQHAEIPTAGIADKAVTSRKQFLDVQWDEGAIAQYKAGVTGAHVFKDNSNHLGISYTPTVDAWWEINGHMGLIQQLTAGASDSYFYMTIACSPAPVSGANGMSCIGSNNSDNGAFGSRNAKALFALAADITYTVKLVQGFVNAWQYYQDAARLGLYGKAWAR